MSARLFYFVGGGSGSWRITRMQSVAGESLPDVPFLNILKEPAAADGSNWVLRGITSNERYVTRDEKSALVANQEALGRPRSTCGALIPIRKNADWWSLSQDDRRKIFEEQSGHIRTGLRFLPAVARRLHHCRDLSASEPFDFLTWFEYAPAEENAFDNLLAQLRASPEWKFVSREIDIRVKRVPLHPGDLARSGDEEIIEKMIGAAPRLSSD